MSAVLNQVDTRLHNSLDTLRIERFTPNLGATVSGIDLSQGIDDDLAAALRQALLDHAVLFFREQTLTPAQYLAFGELFGEPLRHNPYLPSLEENSGVEVIEVSKQTKVPNDWWHTDVSWKPNPPKATVLYAKELPDAGGDTVWTSSTGAYDALHPKLAEYLETLTAVNAIDANGQSRSGDYAERLEQLRVKYPPIDVPVIATHPETGRKYVFATEASTRYIKGVSRTTSESLLGLLHGVLLQPELQARFVWAPGSLAIWDNRQVHHRAIRDYGDQRRVLLRITLQ